MSIPTNVELKEQLDRIEKKVDAIYREVYRREYDQTITDQNGRRHSVMSKEGQDILRSIGFGTPDPNRRVVSMPRESVEIVGVYESANQDCPLPSH